MSGASFRLVLYSPPLDSVRALARIRSHARLTPLLRSRALSEGTGADVWLKLENLQETGSFKFRGAANKLLSMPAAQWERGVVTASNGNHALGVATIGRHLGIATEVFVLETIDLPRQQRIEACGAKVVKVPGDSLRTERTARRAAEATGRSYISPYNDLEVVAGQGTIAVEVLDQLPGLAAIFVAAGGGGLIGGIGAHLRRASPGTRVVAGWPEVACSLHQCLRLGRIVDAPESPSLSTSTAGGPEEGSITFPLAQQVIDTQVLVSEDEILAACRRCHRDENQLVEGAAGVAVASFLKLAGEFVGRTVVIVICGGNVSPAITQLITS